MPGFNRRGPKGMGPMSGRGMGRCRDEEGGWGGMRGGGGFGRRRGFGDGRCLAGQPPVEAMALSPEEELAQLKARAASLQGGLEEILQRIGKLEAYKKE